MAHRTNDFQTIRSEGGLLPPDLLRRVLDPKEKLPGTRSEDYELPQSERLNEVITQSWNRLRRHWAEFRAAAANLPEGEPGTGLTNDRWNLPVLRELGFGLVPASAGPEVGGRTYAINRFFGPVPLHLIGCGLSLDRRAAGVRGAAIVNPHGLVQEFLNRSPGHLWAIVTNGLRLRILRDNQALSRQSFLEFDLEAMFAGEVYSDFVLFWLMAHATRFTPREAERLDSCWLEQWTKLANEQGTRALGDLRGGVEKALEILGEGFTSHPKNTALRDTLRTGQVSLADFHGQLLRVVYRLIFLFVAEDRTIDGVSLLHPRREREIGSREVGNRDNETEAPSPISLLAIRCSLYAEHYSTARLRELASQIKGSRHGDLWQQFNLLVGALSGHPHFSAVREHLALPALGSFLWDPASTSALNHPLLATSLLPTSLVSAELTNFDFLEALRHLAFTRQGKVLRPVDYKNLGAEELGGVYESLLALTPQISADGARFTFAEFAGNERKTSGSYYTPDSLVQCLLDSALDPVVEARLSKARELANREIASRGRDIYASRLLSRPDRLAEGDGPSGTVLPADQGVSEGRAIRHDVSDTSSVSLDTGKHRGGLGPGGNPGIHPVPSGGSGKPEGARNPSAPLPKGGAGGGSSPATPSDALHRSGQDDTFPDWFFAAQAEVGPISLPPYSLLAEKALLSLKVCDPAVGSGHFLVGAAHRLARHLARVRALAQGESEPSPLLYQHALRDVIGRCLYGVDINPMAAELCRVSLWLEALEPGKPLSFLDHHIRVGNSLLGGTPTLLAQGIPDDAFKPIEGDDKEICRKFKKQNKEERGEGTIRGQGSLFDAADQPWQRLGDLATGLLGLEDISDDTIAGVQQKQERYAELVRSSGYLYGRLWADAWCAAFVWKKTKEFPYPITEEVFRRIERNPFSIASWMRDEIQRLAQQYQFFHWHLEFPDVFAPAIVEAVNSEVANKGIGSSEVANREEQTQDPLSPYSLSPYLPTPSFSGGFDVILGNPPWERVKLQEQEFFASRNDEIATAANAAARKKLIAALPETNATLWSDWCAASREAEGQSHFARQCARYPLCGKGDVNTYALFAEHNRAILGPNGRAGFIVPTGIATDDTTKEYFCSLLNLGNLRSLYDFQTGPETFGNLAHGAFRFCLLTISAQHSDIPSDLSFFASSAEDLQDSDRHFSLSPVDFSTLNPNTRTCPTFRSRSDAELNLALYRHAGVLWRENDPKGNLWGLRFMRMLDMANDSGLFRTRAEMDASGYRLVGNTFEHENERFLPLYEAKMVDHFDHRYASLVGMNAPGKRISRKLIGWYSVIGEDPFEIVQPQYWVPSSEVDERLHGRWDRDWLLGWRDICRSTDQRTVIASLIPRGATGDTFLLGIPAVEPLLIAAFYANLCSFTLDYAARQKVGGTHLKYHVFKQLPILPPAQYSINTPWLQNMVLCEWLLPRVLELTYTAWDLEPFARDCVEGLASREIGSREGLAAYVDQFVPAGTDPSSLPPYSLPPFRWDEERRFLLRCELDAAFFHLYLGGSSEWTKIGSREIGSREEAADKSSPNSLLATSLTPLLSAFPTPRDAVAFIMDTFPIVRRKDEAKFDGDYRTKRVILEIYDAMAESIRTGEPYQTLLDPPPADPKCCHPPRQAVAG